MELRLPFGGVSDLLGPERQADNENGLPTTKDAANVYDMDAPSGASLIAQRGGQTKHTSAALIADTKVSLICDVLLDNPTNTYANLASNACTVEWSATTPNTGDVLAQDYDDFGNRYVIDGNVGVVKYNADGRKVWKIALPATSPASVVRALCVDRSNGWIYVGISAGGDPKDAKLWGYQQIEDDKTKLEWELQPGWFTESLRVVGTTLYAAQNDTVLLRSRMAFYTGITLRNPSLSKEWSLLVYPVNDMDVSPKDGSVASCSEPNAQRGLSPRSRETSLSSVYWTPRQLDNWSQRTWAWWMADDIDGDGSLNSEYTDGEEIESLTDVSGNGRDWLPRGTDTMPIVKKASVAGRDSLYFNGTDCSMSSAAGVSTSRLYRKLNRTALPCYEGAQFVLTLAVRTDPSDTVRRWIMGTPQDNAVSNSRSRALFSNITCDGSVANNAAWGNVALYEQKTGATTVDHPAGNNGLPLTGPFNQDGLLILQWVFDGGVDDALLNPTRSAFFVNGRPCDRWHSDTAFKTTLANYFGWMETSSGSRFETTANTVSRFQGEFLEAHVLCDWSTTAAGFTAAESIQKLVTLPVYPDGVSSWGQNGDTELERICGYMAHKWGMAHKLPAGQYNALAITAGSNAGDGETVVIGSRTYTFKTALGSSGTVADQVHIGSNAFESLRNLARAINLAGVAATDYGSATTANADVWAVGAVYEGEPNGGSGSTRSALIVQSLDANATAITTTETLANGAWIAGATTVRQRDSAQDSSAPNQGGFNCGHYPHPFFLYNVTSGGTIYSNGGPPNPRGVTGFNPYRDLTKPWGMLCKWDANSGLLKNVLVSGGSFGTTVGFGGVGYGVRWNSVGDLYSIGPRQAASGVIGADNVDVRKVVDYANEDAASGNRGFNVTRGTTATDAWEANPGAQTYHYPRMDVDKWDNLYVPLQGATAQTAAIYAKLAASNTAGSGADVLLLMADIANNPAANCIAIDPKYPTFPNGYSKPRSERVFVGVNRIAGTSTLGILAVRVVSVTPSNVSPRVVTRLGVCGGALYKVLPTPSASVLIDASAFDSGARFIDSCEIQGKRVFVDGVVTKVYDPVDGTLSFLRSRTAGQLPLRSKLCTRYCNRLYFARPADEPQVIVGSKRGDMYGWDFDPQGEQPLAVAAFRTDLTTSGDFSDIPTGLAPYHDDLLFVFGERSVFQQTGDPAEGGHFDLVVRGIGAAFGRAHCLTPDGRLWWITNQAELYYMPVGSRSPVLASRHVQRRLAAALDFSVARPELIYNPAYRSLDLMLFPNGVGDTLLTHFRINLDTMAWWPVTYATAGVQPTAAFLADGDSPGERVFLLGSRDGYVRQDAPSAKSDDGTRIDSKVLVGPLEALGNGVEAGFDGLEVFLAHDQDGARYEVYASDEPGDLGVAVASGPLVPGRNTPTPRFSGAWVGVQVTGPMALGRFALRRVMLSGTASNYARARGH